MRRLIITLLAALLLLAAFGGDVQARLVVYFGTHEPSLCIPEVGLSGCTVKRIWFSNQTDTPLHLSGVELNGTADVFSLVIDQDKPASCLDGALPAHGSCFVTIAAG